MSRQTIQTRNATSVAVPQCPRGGPIYIRIQSASAMTVKLQGSEVDTALELDVAVSEVIQGMEDTPTVWLEIETADQDET